LPVAQARCSRSRRVKPTQSDTAMPAMKSGRYGRNVAARPAPESPAAARKSGPEQHSIDMKAALTLPTAETTIFPNGTSQGTRI
jgi:hypothetical protein